MNLVLLPGMDGTGRLFQPLLSELPLDIKTQVITYSNQKNQTYSDLIEEIKSQLPRVPFVLLAESFSGILAFRLSLDSSLAINKIILVASFLQSPRPKLLMLAKAVPISKLLSLPIPSMLLRKYCFASNAKEELLMLLKNTVKQVEPNVLAFRLRMLLELKRPLEVSQKNCLVIISSSDKLVPMDVSSAIIEQFSEVEIIEVEGPHFVIQQSPSLISKLVTDFVKS